MKRVYPRRLSLLFRSLIGIPVFLAVSTGAFGQEDFYHPELEWKTIETKHFFVHYHDGAERTARVVSKVAEDVYEPVTSLYNHEPDGKVSFVVRDCDDISNGGAYFFDNKVEIFAPNMDFELRGTHNWLRNVVTHEFTHIVQIQTSMKFGRRIPSFYFQWLGYESERRPDVLYGYPNVIVSYPLSGFVVPAWFAEGIAQYNRPDLRYDFWDSHRDMILRSYALDGNMLTWEQMGVFGKTSLGNESSYNAGFAFVSYIGKTYGDHKLREISRNLSSLTALAIDGAIERAVGRSGAAVYDDWRQSVQREYERRVAPLRGHLREGTWFIPEDASTIVDPGQRAKSEPMARPRNLPPGAHWEPCCGDVAGTGFANMYPAYSPDGKKVAYVSTKGADYFRLSSLYVYDFEKQKETVIQPGVSTAPCWSPDGTSLFYARATRRNPHWSYQFDLYRYDLVAEEEHRVTNGLRAISPTISPDGRKLACAVNGDGTTNLVVMNVDGTGSVVITSYHNGEQVYNPQWSPRGDRILFDHSERDGRDIAWIKPDGSDLQFLVNGSDDSRGAAFTPDGTRVVFCSDRTGIYNLYIQDLPTGTVRQVTNVLGGAFFPTTNAAGDIVYSSYGSSGYKLARLTKADPLSNDPGRYADPLPDDSSSVSIRTLGVKQFDWAGLRAYDDTQLTPLSARPYKPVFTSLTVVPFVRVDNYNTSSNGLDMVKPGVYLFSNDLLEKTGIFAGAALNRKLERDLFLQFFYRGRIPVLYQAGLEPSASLELYNVSRKTDTFVSLPDRDPFKVDVTYDLFEFDCALSQPFVSQFSNIEFRYSHSRYSSALGSFNNTATNELIPASSDLYLIANTFLLTFTLDAITPSSTMEINPLGRKISLKIGRELNKFGATDSSGFRTYKITASGLEPQYDKINFTRLEMTWSEHLPFLFHNTSLTANLRGGTILGGPVSDFFDFYLGGLIGMKGYPFYALSGNSLASIGLNYRFPLISNIDLRIGHIYFDKLYASVYGDFGDAWTASKPSLADWKKDAGVEIRLESFSFYAYPTCVFFNASYGFDRFTRFIRTQNAYVTYGREWRFYFGILFGFDYD